MRCRNRHPLYAVSGDSLVKDEGYGRRPKCSNCGHKLRKCGVVQHCPFCKYDLCSNCARAPPGLILVSLPGLKCTAGHRLFSVVAESLVRDEGYTRPACDVCGHDFDMFDVVQHCPSCRFDVCPNCVRTIPGAVLPPGPRCKKGHPLYTITWHSLISDEGYGRPICDRCRHTFRDFDIVQHCPTCEYDLCSRCAKAPPRYVSPVGLKCRARHRMYTVTGESLVVDEGYTSLTCHGCGRGLSSFDAIHHCRICRYDLCNHCSRTPSFSRQLPSAAGGNNVNDNVAP